MHMRTAFVQMNEYRSHGLVLHLAGGRGFQLCSVLRCGYHPYPYQSVLKRGEAKVFWRSGTCSVSTTGHSGLAQVVPIHLILNHLKLLSDCCAPSQSFGPIPAVFLLIPPHFPLPSSASSPLLHHRFSSLFSVFFPGDDRDALLIPDKRWRRRLQPLRHKILSGELRGKWN